MKPSAIPSGRIVSVSGHSNHIYNQSLLATMIKRYGRQKVEAIVRGWAANNPTPHQ